MKTRTEPNNSHSGGLAVAAPGRCQAPPSGSSLGCGIAAHPDERYVLGVAASVPLGANICDFAPDFPYGHLPITLAQVLVRVARGTTLSMPHGFCLGSLAWPESLWLAASGDSLPGA